MKNKYSVTIEETISKTFEVLAEDDEQAKNIALEKYMSGEFVLEPGNIIAKQMQVENAIDNCCTDWNEF